jgi:hypothetical protein
MSRTGSEGRRAAEFASAINKDINRWFELQGLADDFHRAMSEEKLAVLSKIRPPVRGLLDNATLETYRNADLDARAEAAAAVEADRYLKQRIQQCQAYVWLSELSGFREIEASIVDAISRPTATSGGKRSSNTIRFLQVLTPIVIQWALLRDGRDRKRITRVSLTKKQMRAAAAKADELAQLLRGVLDSRSSTADRLYSFTDWETNVAGSSRLWKILSDSSLEWRQGIRSRERGAREDETTLDRRFIGDLSTAMRDAFGMEFPKEVEQLAAVFGFDLHRSSIHDAIKLRGKGSR